MSNDSTYPFYFTQDWFSVNIPLWTELFGPIMGQPNLRFLEIGSFQGRSSVWLLQNVLTHPTSRLTCVDTWEGSAEHTDQDKNNFRYFFKQYHPFQGKSYSRAWSIA